MLTCSLYIGSLFKKSLTETPHIMVRHDWKNESIDANGGSLESTIHNKKARQ
eukprot:m.157482 g.157482  ORF g.157482 m.157482 type:complete len:52 (-) comp17971_c0_seq4:989-1144(-)